MTIKKSKYFRISLTDKCNLSCYFCHNEGQEKNANKFYLSAEEICDIAAIAKELGYTKFKLTGGEPSLHPQIMEIIRGISALKVDDLSMITNGNKLQEYSQQYLKEGLQRLNVSLYTIDPVKFRRNNGGSKRTLERILAGIDEAIKVGYENLKLNYIWDDEDNINDFLSVCEFARNRNLTVVLLPMIILGNTNEDEEVKLESLYLLLKSLGIEKEQIIVDNEGISKRLITLNNGTKVLIRMEELSEKYPYNACKTCEKTVECREGIFPTRLSASGMLYPCLADTDRGISLLEAIKQKDTLKIYNAFDKIMEF